MATRGQQEFIAEFAQYSWQKITRYHSAVLWFHLTLRNVDPLEELYSEDKDARVYTKNGKAYLPDECIFAGWRSGPR